MLVANADIVAPGGAKESAILPSTQSGSDPHAPRPHWAQPVSDSQPLESWHCGQFWVSNPHHEAGPSRKAFAEARGKRARAHMHTHHHHHHPPKHEATNQLESTEERTELPSCLQHLLPSDTTDLTRSDRRQISTFEA